MCVHGCVYSAVEYLFNGMAAQWDGSPMGWQPNGMAAPNLFELLFEAIECDIQLSIRIYVLNIR